MKSIGWRLTVSGPGGDDSSSGGGSDLEAAKTPWRSGLTLVTDKKESPWNQMDLMQPIQLILMVLSLQRNFKFIGMKMAWDRKATLEVNLHKDDLG